MAQMRPQDKKIRASVASGRHAKIMVGLLSALQSRITTMTRLECENHVAAAGIATLSYDDKAKEKPYIDLVKDMFDKLIDAKLVVADKSAKPYTYSLTNKGRELKRADMPDAVQNAIAGKDDATRVTVVPTAAKPLAMLNRKAGVKSVEPGANSQPQGSTDPVLLSSPEGKRLLKFHLTRERNPKLAKEKKRLAQAEFGCLRCAVCTFDFTDRYGPHGDGFIECHHTKSLSDRLEEEETLLEDLELVCANCHRMLHRGSRMLSIAELRAMLLPTE